MDEQPSVDMGYQPPTDEQGYQERRPSRRANGHEQGAQGALSRGPAEGGQAASIDDGAANGRGQQPSVPESDQGVERTISRGAATTPAEEPLDPKGDELEQAPESTSESAPESAPEPASEAAEATVPEAPPAPPKRRPGRPRRKPANGAAKGTAKGASAAIEPDPGSQNSGEETATKSKAKEPDAAPGD